MDNILDRRGVHHDSRATVAVGIAATQSMHTGAPVELT